MSISWILARLFVPETVEDENIVEGSWRELA
jgi:hypothetical protein